MLARLPLRSRILAVAAAGVLLAAGGWMWLRDSSLVRVRDVYIVGVSSSQEAEIRGALRSAARDMTTLRIREQQLRTAVKPFPSVADIHVSKDFPHKLTIEVVERQPIAAVDTGSSLVPVGAGGLLMRGVKVDRTLPRLRARRITGNRLTDPKALGAVAVLAAAPEPLRRRVDRVTYGRRGLYLDLRRGPALVFGNRGRPNAKWAAAARVLADPTSAGAVYLDVRVPERVGAAGLGPLPDPVTVANPQAQPENTATLNP